MNDRAPAPAPKQNNDRTPIPIKWLIISQANPNGVMLPKPGGGLKQDHQVTAGDHGDMKTEIDWMPWLRRYRVVRYTKEGANDKVTWKAHDPFFIPESWCVHVEADL